MPNEAEFKTRREIRAIVKIANTKGSKMLKAEELDSKMPTFIRRAVAHARKVEERHGRPKSVPELTGLFVTSLRTTCGEFHHTGLGIFLTQILCSREIWNGPGRLDPQAWKLNNANHYCGEYGTISQARVKAWVEAARTEDQVPFKFIQPTEEESEIDGLIVGIKTELAELTRLDTILNVKVRESDDMAAELLQLLSD